MFLVAALGACAAALPGCSTASWAESKPSGPSVVLHPDQDAPATTASIASVPDIN